MEIKLEMKMAVDGDEIHSVEIKLENGDENTLIALAELALDKCKEECKKILTQTIKGS